MEVKEAIEKVQNLYTYWINYLDLNDSEIIKTEKEEEEIINLLQQGEENKKYKQVGELFKKRYGNYSIYVGAGIDEYNIDLIKNIEQEYFPEEEKK